MMNERRVIEPMRGTHDTDDKCSFCASTQPPPEPGRAADSEQDRARPKVLPLFLLAALIRALFNK